MRGKLELRGFDAVTPKRRQREGTSAHRGELPIARCVQRKHFLEDPRETEKMHVGVEA